MAHIIAGVDPGKTTGIACLDLNGNIISLKSSRFVGLDWLVRQISDIGTPVIIASDKKNSTSLTDKLSAAFNCAVFAPDEDLSTRRKDMMTKNAGAGNMHERDALSAALSAYNAYANKFKQAERLARSSNYQNVDRLKAMIVSKYSIHDVVTDRKAGKR